jgi:actin related protein 2/3 complex subunit 2
VLLKSLLTDKIVDGGAPTSIDQVVSDFDNVTYHISTPESKTKIVVSLSIKSWPDLKNYGVDIVLDREYGKYKLSPPEHGYDYSVLIDLGALPESLEQRQELVERVSLLRRNALAAPFEAAFAKFEELAKDAAERNLDLYAPEHAETEIMTIRYRDEESIFVRPSHDRVTVIFSTTFKDETDQTFGRVFLQEFVDARRRAIQNAPQVLFSDKEPPLEVRGLVPPAIGDRTGYVTFVLFPRHLTRDRQERCISHIQMFRDYFHYHIKCSKAYMHSRMRHRVAEFQKSLNRAKPDKDEGVKERKTASGRRFRAAV